MARLGLPPDALISLTGPRKVSFSYMNHKGVFRRRKAIMLGVFWGSDQWHSTPQWLVKGQDLEKDAVRTFALKNIRNVRALGDEDE